VKFTQSSGKFFCEEFSSHVYEDFNRHSILVNIDHEWFAALIKGMEKRKYKLVHVTEMPKSITCVFTKS
jgi:hypothetical protein